MAPLRFTVFFLIATGAVVLGGCKAKIPAISQPWNDGFERGEVGPSWLDTSGGQARVMNGKLVVQEGRNRPLWLRKRLPPDGVIELEVMSKSPDGDIKVEAWGDGESFDPDQGTYHPTGYVFVFGGWNNTRSIIGKLGEHDDGEKVHRTEPAVEPGRTYRFNISRKGGQIDWKIDGQPFLSWTDPAPLAGEKHEYFAVTNWRAEVHVDNLSIRPTP